MRELFAGFLILLACASEGSAHGSIARGNYGFTSSFTTAQNYDNETDAKIAAVNECIKQGMKGCTTIDTFQNSCMAVATTEAGYYETGEGQSEEDAQDAAFGNCTAQHKLSCRAAVAVCDETPDVAPATDTTAYPNPFSFLGPLLRNLYVFLGAGGLAGLVLSCLFLRLLASVVFSTPIAVLKRDAVVSTWIAVPAFAAFICWLTIFNPSEPPIYGTAAFVWTDAFAAIMVGGFIRNRVRRWSPAPAALTLPLAVLVFTLVAVGLLDLFIDLGTPWSDATCPDPSYPIFSACGFKNYESFVVPLMILALLVLGGVVLPANSNLVIAYERMIEWVPKVIRRLRARIREKLRDRKIKASAELAQNVAAGNYPVPAIYQAPVATVMQLKLKRSQRPSFLGKVLFILDARMEVTADEMELIRKYRLADDVIYESSKRQQRKEATLAHLEMTKDSPRFREGLDTQLLGLGKMLYRLGRAGVSATAASLSLRITIASLISGVHVECKSLNELLGAEAAIMEAAQNLRGYLTTAATFDGREEVIEL